MAVTSTLETNEPLSVAPSQEREERQVPSSFRRVDWPIVAGSQVRHGAPGPAAGVSGQVDLLSAIDELSCFDSQDAVLKRAVELLRERMNLERCAIFLFQEQDSLLHGSWGTDHVGQTTDEHRIAFQCGPNHREAFRRARAGADRWLLLEDAPRTVQIKGETRVLENGWIVLTPIMSARRPLGLLANDGALTGSLIDEFQQNQAAIFCALLARLMELRAEGSSFYSPFRGKQPATMACTEVVSRAIELLLRNPGIDRESLASELATSSSRIGRLFKTEMGISITEFRNRLRLEEFLLLVHQSGGNLLEAALEAGFGSYAQFHRVFRQLLGTTPREYLSLNESERVPPPSSGVARS